MSEDGCTECTQADLEKVELLNNHLEHPEASAPIKSETPSSPPTSSPQTRESVGKTRSQKDSKLSSLLTKPTTLSTASSHEEIYKNTRAASAKRAQQQISKDGQNECKTLTGCPTSSHSSGSLVLSNKSEGDSSLTSLQESSTSSSSSIEDYRYETESPKPSTSTGGPTGPLRSTDGEPVKKRKSPLVIQDHITVLGGDPVMYQCNICNKKFKTKAQIKYHEFCTEKDKPFKCETCGQGFITKHHYEYHLRTHTGERSYVCPKCGKGFNQRGQVTRHMRSHTGEKPFVCQECNQGFANAQALRCHTLIHTGDRPFACTYCNKRFIGMTNLKRHLITQH